MELEHLTANPPGGLKDGRLVLKDVLCVGEAVVAGDVDGRDDLIFAIANGGGKADGAVAAF